MAKSMRVANLEDLVERAKLLAEHVLEVSNVRPEPPLNEARELLQRIQTHEAIYNG